MTSNFQEPTWIADFAERITDEQSSRLTALVKAEIEFRELEELVEYDGALSDAWSETRYETLDAIFPQSTDYDYALRQEADEEYEVWFKAERAALLRQSQQLAAE